MLLGGLSVDYSCQLFYTQMCTDFLNETFNSARVFCYGALNAASFVSLSAILEKPVLTANHSVVTLCATTRTSACLNAIARQKRLTTHAARPVQNHGSET